MTNRPRRERYFPQFLVSESDRYGRSVSLTFRIQPSLDCDLTHLVRSGRLPFQTKEDAARWAFCLGFRSLSLIRDFEYSCSFLDSPLRLYLREPPIKPDELMRRVETIVGNLSALGYRPPQLRKFLSVIEDLIGCLPAAYDRESYVTAMERHWPRISELAHIPGPPAGSALPKTDPAVSTSSAGVDEQIASLEQAVSESVGFIHAFLLELIVPPSGISETNTISREQIIAKCKVRLKVSSNVRLRLAHLDKHFDHPLRRNGLHVGRLVCKTIKEGEHL
jgi:hypothetical protein